MKCKEGGSYLYKNQKYRPLKIQNKIFFSVISFQIFLICHMCVFSENAEFSSEYSFNFANQKINN